MNETIPLETTQIDTQKPKVSLRRRWREFLRNEAMSDLNETILFLQRVYGESFPKERDKQEDRAYRHMTAVRNKVVIWEKALSVVSLLISLLALWIAMK